MRDIVGEKGIAGRVPHFWAAFARSGDFQSVEIEASITVEERRFSAALESRTIGL
jgi:hypothetical protein